MKPTKFLLTVFAFATAVLFLSCKKNNETTVTDDTDVAGAQDNALAENTSNDAVSMSSQATDNGTISHRPGTSYQVQVLFGCVDSVTRNDSTKKVYIYFNNSVCTDGRIRTGTLTIDFSASTNGAMHYRDPGFSMHITSSNYVVDGNQVTIDKTVTNTTPVSFNPATTNATWHITSNIQIVKTNNAGTINWSCTRDLTLLNTSTTYPYLGNTSNNCDPAICAIDWANARIGLTGSASGSRSSGETFTVTVTSQLVKDFRDTNNGGCTIYGRHPFFMGSLDYTPGSKPTRHVDYGSDGSGNISNNCDLYAKVSLVVNGTTYTRILAI
jgi:hypothetical protein